MKVFVIDTYMCDGCYNCQLACKDEYVGNDWSPYSLPQPDIGQLWMRVNEIERGTKPRVTVNWVATPCQHCDNAPCIKAATNGAVYKRSDGLVVIDPVKSVGQKQIPAACPYGAIYWNADIYIPQKCTACAHILDGVGIAAGQTQVPKCVSACPTNAITFGDDSDPAIQALIAKAEVLNPEYGTKPRVYYLNLPKPWIAGSVYDPVADECLEGATVTAVEVLSGKTYSATSDYAGDFWLNGLVGNKTYDLTMSMPGYIARKQVVFITDSKNIGDIPLSKGGA